MVGSHGRRGSCRTREACVFKAVTFMPAFAGMANGLTARDGRKKMSNGMHRHGFIVKNHNFSSEIYNPLYLSYLVYAVNLCRVFQMTIT